MKIAIYAIAKNEVKFIDRFLESVIDADEIVIADTGSIDGTLERIAIWSEKHPGKIKAIPIRVNPFRFDFARNAALSLVSDDVDFCVSIDIDEIISPGWREPIEKQFAAGATRLWYEYVWSWAPDGRPDLVFNADKIHARKNYIWRCPAHEYVGWYGQGSEKTLHAPGLRIEHYPDNSKSRSSYMTMLEMGAKEDPWSDRNAYYYARELYFYDRFEESLAEFERHRSLPSQHWPAEKASSHRYSGEIYLQLKQPEKALHEFQQACSVDPLHRESWNQLAYVYYLLEDWAQCLQTSRHAISITVNHKTYNCNEADAFGPQAYDIGSIAAWRMGFKEEAINLATEAHIRAPNDQRIRSNLAMMRGEQIGGRGD